MYPMIMTIIYYVLAFKSGFCAYWGYLTIKNYLAHKKAEKKNALLRLKYGSDLKGYLHELLKDYGAVKEYLKAELEEPNPQALWIAIKETYEANDLGTLYKDK